MRKRGAILSFAGIAAVVPVMVLWSRCSRHRVQAIDPALPEQALAIGDSIVLLDGDENDDQPWQRATAIDAHTGQVTARVIEDVPEAECWPAGDGRVACSFATAQVYDARTLTPVAGAAVPDNDDDDGEAPDTGCAVAPADLADSCQAAEVIDGAIVVATSAKRDRVVAIDRATGAVRWRAGY